jgi:hypothetical protein
MTKIWYPSLKYTDPFLFSSLFLKNSMLGISSDGIKFISISIFKERRCREWTQMC